MSCASRRRRAIVGEFPPVSRFADAAVFEHAPRYHGDDFAGARAYAGVSATAEAVLDIHKNGSPIGTITFGIGASIGSFATAGGGAETFAAGDRLAIINEEPADATLADLSITFLGKRTWMMAWGSDTAATQSTGITTEQFFDQLSTLNPRETAHVQVSADFPSSLTDHAIVAVYTTLDDASEVEGPDWRRTATVDASRRLTVPTRRREGW